MKYFFTSLLTLIAALIVTIIYLPFGFVYTYLHAFYWSIKGKNKRTFFQLIKRQINGTFAVVGYALYHLAIALDMLWNVNGELIEDAVTKREVTEYGKELITVSSSTGREEKENALKPFGKKFSKFLNFAFGQKQHCLDSWHFHVYQKQLKSKYFK